MSTTYNSREILREVGLSIDQDKKIHSFRDPRANQVGWLAHEPHSAMEIIENAYDRLRSAGFSVTVSHNPDDADPVELTTAGLIRMEQANSLIPAEVMPDDFEEIGDGRE